MNKHLLALLLAATTSFSAAQAGAGIAVSGSVGGSVPVKARVGGFVLDSANNPSASNPSAELVSVPVNGGKFSLEVPSVVPPQRTLSSLRPDSIFWPGVLEPVTVSGQVSTADLRFYVYGDANGNGRRDDSEALQEVVPYVGKAVLVVSFVSAPVQVGAARGFQANLKAGWNGLLIEVGKAVKVSSSSNVSGVNLNVQR